MWSQLSCFRLHGALPSGVKEQTSGREHDIPSTLRAKNTEKDVASVPLGRLLSIWTSCISSQMQDAMSWWCCGNVPIHMTTATVILDPGSSVILEEPLTYHTQQIAGWERLQGILGLTTYTKDRMQERVELTFDRERGLRYRSQLLSNNLRWVEEGRSSDSKSGLEREQQ